MTIVTYIHEHIHVALIKLLYPSLRKIQFVFVKTNSGCCLGITEKSLSLIEGNYYIAKYADAEAIKYKMNSIKLLLILLGPAIFSLLLICIGLTPFIVTVPLIIGLPITMIFTYLGTRFLITCLYDIKAVWKYDLKYCEFEISKGNNIKSRI